LVENLRQTGVDMFLSDLTPRDAARFPWLAKWGQRYDPLVGTDVLLREGLPWMGFFAMLVVTAGAVAACVVAVRRRQPLVLVALVPAIVYVLAFYWTRPNFSPAFSRYTMIPVCLALVAAAVGFSALPLRRRGILGVVAPLALLTTLGMTAQADHALGDIGTRPLGRDRAIWRASPVEAFGYTTGFLGAEEKQPFTAAVLHIDSCFAGDATIATLLPRKFPQQLLWGTGFDRTVLQYVEMPGPLDAATLWTEGVDAFVVDTSEVAVPQDDEQLDVTDFGPVAVVGVRTSMAEGCGGSVSPVEPK
jgi:hypothetical protein